MKTETPIYDRHMNENMPKLQNLIPKRILQLQGQCKIRHLEPLRSNKPKAILLTILLIITFFGLFALKYSANFRKYVFYEKCALGEATHLFIQGANSKDQIINIQKGGNFPIKFIYKKLRYTLYREQSFCPEGFNIEQQFQHCICQKRIKQGLSDKQVSKSRQKYGNNQHLVEIPHYFAYLFDVLTAPYFLLQYFFCFMFFLQGYAPFAIALLAFTFITATINYILLHISYKKVKQMAQQTFEVQTIRNKSIVRILNTELVPGDIYIPKNQIPADSLVIKGDIYVNQSNLTGQSHPIGKFPINHIKQIQNSSVWLYQGSKIVDQTQQKRAIVINTNFTTHRGRIIRRILNREVKDPDIIRSLLVLTLQIVIVSIIVFFATINILLSIDIEPLFRFFKFIDFLASSAPPPLPIFFNIAYGLALIRLRFYGIVGTQPQKTVDGAQVKTLCFDKTGTLTESNVQIRRIYSMNKNEDLQEINIKSDLQKQQNFIWMLFSSCHTSKIINGQLVGDQIDKQIYLHSKTYMIKSDDPRIKLKLRKQGQVQNCFLEILKINQFQSKFKSNSVLVYDKQKNKYIVFVKGAPQKLNSASLKPNNKIINKVRNLSLDGFRTIGMAYKQISSDQLQSYLLADRQIFQSQLHFLGLVAFQNKLKQDTVQTVTKLKKSNINTKVITGDNIYIAVQTAIRGGIISKTQKIIYLQGQNQQKTEINDQSIDGSGKKIYSQTQKRIFRGTILDENQQEKQVEFDEKQYLQPNCVYAVDNDFLQLKNRPILANQIKVFARISPENKAQIIRTYRKQDKQRRDKQKTKIQKLLKDEKLKVGMCGDGANDLLALKQADLSIGIQQTDASYGSSFTIKNLLDVEHIIRQAKCTQSNILQLFQFYVAATMTILLISIIMIDDTTYFSTAQLMYTNFGSVLLIAVCLTMNFPSNDQSQTVPDPNAMNLHNHLIIWGHILMPFLGNLGAYLYFSNTDQYQQNPIPRARIDQGGFNSKNHTATLSFLMVILIVPVSAFMIHRSSPYKKRIWFNPLLSILLLANIIVAIVFPFVNKDLEQPFQIQPISIQKIGICFGIMSGALIILIIYNLVVNNFKLNEKVLGDTINKQKN